MRAEHQELRMLDDPSGVCALPVDLLVRLLTRLPHRYAGWVKLCVLAPALHP
jgi:hypothetical protein